MRVTEKPIERLPFDNPKSRFDRFGSDVTVAGGRLYLGTHDGKVVWHFLGEAPASGAHGFPGSPAVGEGLVFATGLDGRVYAFAE